MKFEVWYIIDEDTNTIIGREFGTRKQAEEALEALKENRKPGDDNYWNTWSLFRRYAA